MMPGYRFDASSVTLDTSPSRSLPTMTGRRNQVRFVETRKQIT
jgi:hypothetical protein